MERVIFSVIFFMMLGVPFYLLYKIARDIFGTAGAGEPAQLPQGKQRRSGGAGSGSIGKDTIYRGAAI
ncbi:hypothetical protein ACLB1Q_33690 [Escherichia coli]